MGIAFAAISAILIGVADYAGGQVSRKTDSIVYSFYFQLICIFLLLPLAIVATVTLGGRPEIKDILIGIVFGILAATIGLTVFFRVLAHGNGAMVMPITGAIAPSVATVFALFFLHDHVSRAAMVGIVVAIVAIAVVAKGPTKLPAIYGNFAVLSRDAELAILCGMVFGIQLILTDSTSDHAYLWPLLSARVVGSIVSLFICRQTGQRIRIPIKSWLPWVPAIAADAYGNALFFFAAHNGSFALVAVIGSMGFVVCTFLAVTIRRDPVNKVQAMGLVGAVAAVVLITLGRN